MSSLAQPARRSKRPIVALLGVPNAGKSTLFNRLIGERRALVAEIPGTTRDRLYAPWRVGSRPCILCDTGGIGGSSGEILQAEIERQTLMAVREASVVVLVLDGKAGLTAGDRELASRLRPLADRVIVAWNKADSPARASHAPEAFELGLGDPIPVSAEHGLGVADLVEAVALKLPAAAQGDAPADEREGQDVEEEIRVAIVGRPNVGKSSLLNRLCGDVRVTVAPEPGTTRDPVDTEVVRAGRRYRFVDTAGIRRPSRTQGPLDQLGVMMAKRAVARADVALVLFDAPQGLVSQDLAVAGFVEDSGRGAVLVANKWDLVQDKEAWIKTLQRSARARLRMASYAPFVTLSALGGQRVESLYPIIDTVFEAGDVTIPTPRLNTFLTHFRTRGDAKGPRLRYLTQIGVRPPRFLAFGPDAGKLHFSEVRRLENRLRETFDIGPTPLQVRFRSEKPRTPGARRR